MGRLFRWAGFANSTATVPLVRQDENLGDIRTLISMYLASLQDYEAPSSARIMQSDEMPHRTLSNRTVDHRGVDCLRA
jgi:hypothetical protein